MSRPPGPSGVGVRTQLWRGVVTYRIAALAYAGALILANRDEYAEPRAALVVLAAMAGWTVLMTAANSRDSGRVWPVVVADHAVCVLVTLASVPVQGAERIEADTPTLPTSWAASPVLGLGAARRPGRRRGRRAGAGRGVGAHPRRHHPGHARQPGAAAARRPVGGYVARLAVGAEERLAEAVRLEAATRERERLARDIHDAVLQVLALVQRRGAELGGEAAELARLAGEQEVALRGAASPPPRPRWTRPRRRRAVDLRGAASARVRLGDGHAWPRPATPVPLPAPGARRAGRRGRARRWTTSPRTPGRAPGPGCCVEDDGAAVTWSASATTAPGIAPGRLAAGRGRGPARRGPVDPRAGSPTWAAR